jgi:dTDP-4-dehydrorhamnose reductase
MLSLLLTGAGGQLGSYLLRRLQREGASFAAWSGSRTEPLFDVPLRAIDLGDRTAVTRAFQADPPALVVHCAALARIGDCYRAPALARRVNTEAAAHLADLCAAHGARLVSVSTDLVFDGEHAPYRESDLPAPLSVYGRSKADGEQAVLAQTGNLVVRVSLLFGPAINDRSAFFGEQTAALRAGRSIPLFFDEFRTPLALSCAAEGLLLAARSTETGVLHLGGPDRLSRLEMGRKLAEVMGLDPSVLVPTSREQVPAGEPRPCDVSLDSSRFRERFPQWSCPDYSKALRGMLS